MLWTIIIGATLFEQHGRADAGVYSEQVKDFLGSFLHPYIAEALKWSHIQAGVTFSCGMTMTVPNMECLKPSFHLPRCL